MRAYFTSKQAHVMAMADMHTIFIDAHIYNPFGWFAAWFAIITVKDDGLMK